MNVEFVAIKVAAVLTSATPPVALAMFSVKDESVAENVAQVSTRTTPPYSAQFASKDEAVAVNVTGSFVHPPNRVATPPTFAARFAEKLHPTTSALLSQ